MKPRLIAIGVLLAGLGAAALADDSHLEARRLAREGQILTLQQILGRIGKIQPGQILEVELEREHARLIYEIELLDKQGTVWEFKLDAVSGEILERELED
jgi:uncharacterized membrane protein YkoI